MSIHRRIVLCTYLYILEWNTGMAIPQQPSTTFTCAKSHFFPSPLCENHVRKCYSVWYFQNFRKCLDYFQHVIVGESGEIWNSNSERAQGFEMRYSFRFGLRYSVTVQVTYLLERLSFLLCKMLRLHHKIISVINSLLSFFESLLITSRQGVGSSP